MAVAQQHENLPGQMPSHEQDVPSLFSDFDLYLFGQGKHYRIYEKMEAHPRTVNGVEGVNFAVWVPNARSVSVIGNFTPMTRYGYRLGVPYAGEYYEVINSDATRYGGSGVENPQTMPSGSIPWQSCPHSILLTLPPLASVILKRRPISRRDRNPYVP